jgi:hypothetical protein
MIDWPKDLIEDIARRRSVLVLGAGISKNASTSSGKRPKDWTEFLQEGAKYVTPHRHISKLISRGDFLTACEIIKTRMGKDDFHSFVIAEFLTPQFHAAKLHEDLFKLDSRIVATPNFDKIYDSHANHLGHGSVKVKRYYEDDLADAVRRSNPFVLKIHGCIDEPGKMIFSRQDYAAARNRYANFYSILDALAITHTFIFLGCGVNDPDVRLILENYAFRFKDSRSHFIVMPRRSCHEDEKTVIQSSMNLKVLTYDAKNNHAELGSSIEQLTQWVDAQRQSLAASLGW